MNTLKAITYERVSTSKQTGRRQHENLKIYAEGKGYEIVQNFNDTISGKSMSTERVGFSKMIKYVQSNDIQTIFCSEISRIGRRVSDVVHTIEKLVEEYGMTIYFQHPNDFHFKPDKNGRVDILQKSMLMMLSLGAEMELHYQSARRIEGIEIAKKEGRYKGRIKGSRYSIDQLLEKHNDIVQLLKNSSLSDTQIAKTLKKGLSTVKRVKKVM